MKYERHAMILKIIEERILKLRRNWLPSLE